MHLARLACRGAPASPLSRPPPGPAARRRGGARSALLPPPARAPAFGGLGCLYLGALLALRGPARAGATGASMTESGAAGSGEEGMQIVAYTPPLGGLLDGLYERSLTYNLTIDSKDITVRLEQQFGGEGLGTGAAAWPAAYYLAMYLAGPHSAALLPGNGGWEGRRVVELGSGLGLVAVAAAHLGAEVTATDGVAELLPLLRRNIAANTEGVRHPVEVAQLRWGVEEQEAAVLAGGAPEVVLAADVVYGDKVANWRALLASLAALGRPGGLILLAHTSRYPEKERGFFQIARARVEEVPRSHLHTAAGKASKTSLYVLRPKRK